MITLVRQNPRKVSLVRRITCLCGLTFPITRYAGEWCHSCMSGDDYSPYYPGQDDPEYYNYMYGSSRFPFTVHY